MIFGDFPHLVFASGAVVILAITFPIYALDRVVKRVFCSAALNLIERGPHWFEMEVRESSKA